MKKIIIIGLLGLAIGITTSYLKNRPKVIEEPKPCTDTVLVMNQLCYVITECTDKVDEVTYGPHADISKCYEEWYRRQGGD